MHRSKTKRASHTRESLEISSCEIDFDKLEADPKFIEMMEQSAADIRAGRVFSHEYVERIIRAKRSSM
jgi:hypothetical protein